MRRKSMLFVGDHARMYFGSASKVDEIDNDVHLLRYQREDIITNEPAKALFDSVSLSFNETYSLDGLHKDLIKNKQHLPPRWWVLQITVVVVVRDPNSNSRNLIVDAATDY